jgi:excisionase family DNA binding protein
VTAEMASARRATRPPLLLTVEEAAAELHIGRRRVFDLISSGELRSKKIGRSRRIPFDACVEYVDSLPDEPAPH